MLPCCCWFLCHVSHQLLSFFHTFILKTYIVPLQETTTQRFSQPSHGQRRRTLERCKIWKGGPSEGTAALLWFDGSSCLHCVPFSHNACEPLDYASEGGR